MITDGSQPLSGGGLWFLRSEFGTKLSLVGGMYVTVDIPSLSCVLGSKFGSVSNQVWNSSRFRNRIRVMNRLWILLERLVTSFF